MENKFTYETVVDTHDTDPAGYVRPSALLKYMQEAANIQIARSTPSANDLRREGRYFVVTKLNMSVIKPLHAREPITVSTWACPSKGANFIRCGSIHRGGELCASLYSNWALIDAFEGGFVRVSAVDFDFGTSEPSEPSMPPKIHIPEPGRLMPLGAHTVGYRDADVNRHMNNTVYADILYGFLQNTASRCFSDITVNYLHEAPLGCRFDISGYADGDVHYFRTVLEDGTVGIEAIIRTKEK